MVAKNREAQSRVLSCRAEAAASGFCDCIARTTTLPKMVSLKCSHTNAGTYLIAAQATSATLIFTSSEISYFRGEFLGKKVQGIHPPHFGEGLSVLLCGVHPGRKNSRLVRRHLLERNSHELVLQVVNHSSVR